MGNWFSDHVDFYHYTSESGIDAMMDSGYIKESQTGGPDAFFGSGRRTLLTLCGISAKMETFKCRMDLYDY